MNIENQISMIETKILFNLAYANCYGSSAVAYAYLERAKELIEQKEKLLIQSEEETKQRITEFNEKYAKRENNT